MTEYRTEHDTMGEVRLPKEAYYGAQTQRAVENFPISGRTAAPELIHALGLVKWCAARANRDLGLLSSGRSPLSDAEITSEYQYGISNEVVTGKTAKVYVKEGRLLLIKCFER